MKKRIILGFSFLLTMGIFSQTALSADAAAPSSIMELRQEKIAKKLAFLQEKAGVEVKNRVQVKIEEKEAAIAKKKADEQAAAKKKQEEADKQAAELAAQETAKAEQQAVEQAAQQEAAQETYTADNSQPDVTTSASQSGREIGEKNREYGEQLSNPDLSWEERQQIIQEKKNYNQNNHGGW